METGAERPDAGSPRRGGCKVGRCVRRWEVVHPTRRRWLYLSATYTSGRQCRSGRSRSVPPVEYAGRTLLKQNRGTSARLRCRAHAARPTRKFDRKSQVFCLEIPGRLGYRAKPTSMERFTWDSVQRRPGPCGSTWDFESNVADRPGWDPQPLCSCRFARQQSPPARNKL